MALTIGASLRRVWRGLAILLLLSASFSSKAHEIRPALLELTQLTETQWRLRFRQPQMMGRVLPLVPQSNCMQEERGVTLALDAVETEYALSCPEGLRYLAMPGLEGTLADAMVTLLPLTGALQQFSLSPKIPNEISAKALRCLPTETRSRTSHFWDRPCLLCAFAGLSLSHLCSYCSCDKLHRGPL